MNILIIEDDEQIYQNIKKHFFKSGFSYRIEHVKDYDTFLIFANKVKFYDIVLLDIELSKNNNSEGFIILEYIKNNFSNIPIVIISGNSGYYFLQRAFFLGAVDYIIKPFRVRELEIRIQKWFHCYIFSDFFSVNKNLEYNGLSYNIREKIFYYQNKPLQFSRTEKKFLEILLINREQVVSVEFLSQKIYNDFEMSKTSKVRIMILRIRTKIKLLNIDSWIITIPGEGYMLKSPYKY